MKTIKVLNNQSVLDISIQYTGSVFNAFAIAAANNLCITDNLVLGSTLNIPDSVEIDDFVLNYYILNEIEPATGITDLSIIPTGKGIGWMQIENTFKVS
ncbi:MAG: hypothetical protein WCJ72_05565 [Chryseobacterium sp.]